MNDNDMVEQIFSSLRTNVLQQIAALPKDAEGCVRCTGPQLGVIILAASLQLAEELRCDPKDMKACVDAVMAPKVVLC